MANKSKCPYCNSTITRLNVEEIELERDGGGPWKGATFACPVCRKILTVAVHPEFSQQKILSQVQTIVESSLKK